MGEGAADSDLLALAAARFDQLSDAERKLLQAASTGEVAPADLNAPETDPANAQSWGQDRAIRATLIQWLCFERKAREQVHAFGIQAIGARIEGRLDLSFATFTFPLRIKACWWPGGMVLQNTSLPELSLTKCWVGPLSHEAGVGESSLPAIMARGVQIKGSLFLDGKFHAEGCVRLDMAEVDGALNCDGGSFKNAEGVALDAEGAKIGGPVSLQENFESEGRVLLKSAEIGGALMCDGSFRNANGVALSAEAAKIGGAVCLHHNFKSEGEVLLGGADIGGALNCDGGRFKIENANHMALSAYRAKIGGDVFLGNENRCEGQVQLDGAEIRGALNCNGGVFIEKANRAALSAKGAKIGGDVLFGDESRCEGGVLLDRAEIGGALHCKGGVFKNINGTALNANYAKIGRDVILELAIEGIISLEGASIAGDLTLSSKRISEASPTPAAGATLNLQRANIMGTLDLEQMPKEDVKTKKKYVKTTVDLGDTSCTVFKKHVSNPGEEHKLELHGFVYRRIEGQDPKAQLEWLRQQLRVAQQEERGLFRPQPYRQFANSLRVHGHDAEARACLISMAKDRRLRANLGWPSRAWQWILWTTIRNGHQPLRALYFLIVLWALGFLAFGWGYQKLVMEPSDKYAYDGLTQNKALPGQYDPFCALVYAVDTILPIVSLGQRDRWHPRAPQTTEPQTTASQTAASQTAASQTTAAQTTAAQTTAAQATAAQTEEHSSPYGFFCEASFTGHWDPHGKWVEPSTLATLLAALRWAWVVLGWFFASMLVVGISGLVGRE
jgi:hypothetical protein